MARPRQLLIVDLEATCWDRSRHRPEDMETIEIGALLVDPLAPEEPAREFQAFVRPVHRPQLSAYCTALTSIEQRHVDGVDDFSVVFPRFVGWLAETSGAPQSVHFASWGRYDRRQLEQDCARHGLDYPFGDEHLNLKHWCAQRLGARPGGLSQALERLGLAFEGQRHRGLDDARNIWRVTRRLAGGDLGAWAREGS